MRESADLEAQLGAATLIMSLAESACVIPLPSGSGALMLHYDATGAILRVRFRQHYGRAGVVEPDILQSERRRRGPV